LAAIGPGVQACCYEVGEEVRTKFEAQFAYATNLFRELKESRSRAGEISAALPHRSRPRTQRITCETFSRSSGSQPPPVARCGLPAKNIDATAPCTACHKELLFSYRAEKGVTGRMMAAAGIEAK